MILIYCYQINITDKNNGAFHANFRKYKHKTENIITSSTSLY